MSYCPYSNSECKVNACRFWSKLEGDCLVALTLEGDAKFRLEVEEARQVGLINRAMVNNLVIKRLYGEAEKKQEELDLGRLW